MSKKSKPKTTVRYRHAGNGRFVKPGVAKRMNKNNVVRERVPTPGNGDT